LIARRLPTEDGSLIRYISRPMRSGPVPELVALAGLLPFAVAHLHHGQSNYTVGVGGVMASSAAPLSTNSSVSATPPSEPGYFTDAAYSSLLITHVATMTSAWLFLLPIGSAITGSLSRRLGTVGELTFLR
jgi:hypothetical protein